MSLVIFGRHFPWSDSSLVLHSLEMSPLPCENPSRLALVDARPFFRRPAQYLNFRWFIAFFLSIPTLDGSEPRDVQTDSRRPSVLIVPAAQ